jgi:hypothetical protein
LRLAVAEFLVESYVARAGAEAELARATARMRADRIGRRRRCALPALDLRARGRDLLLRLCERLVEAVAEFATRAGLVGCRIVEAVSPDQKEMR